MNWLRIQTLAVSGFRLLVAQRGPLSCALPLLALRQSRHQNSPQKNRNRCGALKTWRMA